jgi:catechol 2,3-dioxygenase-like lactoylglutathione lyase family enzyme
MPLPVDEAITHGLRSRHQLVEVTPLATRASFAISSIDTITVQVRDIERAIGFYGGVLGLEVRVLNPGRAAEAMLGDVRLLLHVDFDPEIAGKERGAGIAVHFGVDDVDALFEHLGRHGVTVVEAPADHPWGRECAVRDPDGYIVEFVAPLSPAAS